MTSRTPMLRRAALSKDKEPELQARLTRNGEYIVSVQGGPQDLLARGTEKAALEDGKAYVKRNWKFDPMRGWVAV